MIWSKLKAKYGGGKSRETLNRAVKAEFPGGEQLLAAAERLLAEHQRPRADRHPLQVAAVAAATELVSQACDVLRQSVIDSNREQGDPPSSP